MAKRRTSKYIDREVQTGLLVRLSIHWVIFLVANCLGVFFWTRFIEAPTADMNDALRLTAQRLFPTMLISVAIVPVFIRDALKLSNRFAGPIVRIRRTLASISAGNAPRVLVFRTGDFWKSLADDFNRAFVYRFAAPSTTQKSEGA